MWQLRPASSGGSGRLSFREDLFYICRVRLPYLMLYIVVYRTRLYLKFMAVESAITLVLWPTAPLDGLLGILCRPTASGPL
jgi:hypothetical protein